MSASVGINLESAVKTANSRGYQLSVISYWLLVIGYWLLAMDQLMGSNCGITRWVNVIWPIRRLNEIFFPDNL
jgi:hypothetical protein